MGALCNACIWLVLLACLEGTVSATLDRVPRHPEDIQHPVRKTTSLVDDKGDVVAQIPAFYVKVHSIHKYRFTVAFIADIKGSKNILHYELAVIKVGLDRHGQPIIAETNTEDLKSFKHYPYEMKNSMKLDQPYVAALFEGPALPKEFTVGDGLHYGGYWNKALDSASTYVMLVRGALWLKNETDSNDQKYRYLNSDYIAAASAPKSPLFLETAGKLDKMKLTALVTVVWLLVCVVLLFAYVVYKNYFCKSKKKSGVESNTSSKGLFKYTSHWKSHRKSRGSSSTHKLNKEEKKKLLAPINEEENLYEGEINLPSEGSLPSPITSEIGVIESTSQNIPPPPPPRPPVPPKKPTKHKRTKHKKNSWHGNIDMLDALTPLPTPTKRPAPQGRRPPSKPAKKSDSTDTTLLNMYDAPPPPFVSHVKEISESDNLDSIPPPNFSPPPPHTLIPPTQEPASDKKADKVSKIIVPDLDLPPPPPPRIRVSQKESIKSFVEDRRRSMQSDSDKSLVSNVSYSNKPIHVTHVVRSDSSLSTVSTQWTEHSGWTKDEEDLGITDYKLTIPPELANY